MVKIKFTSQGANALIGGFGPNDVANVGDALAKHLVEDARVARYVDAATDVKAKGKPVKGKTKDKPAVPPAPTSDGDTTETTAGN